MTKAEVTKLKDEIEAVKAIIDENFNPEADVTADMLTHINEALAIISE